MKNILLAALLMCSVGYADMYTEIHGDGVYTLSERREADRRVRGVKKQVAEGGFYRLAQLSDNALGGIMKISIMNLKRRGFHSLAEEVETGWRIHKGALIVLALDMDHTGRPIGDFAPLAEWLKTVYEKIESALGLEICRALRISDIKTLNHGLRVVFKPCTYGETEFNYHFIHDDRYRGVFPVIAYWTASLTCSIATFGAGYFFICSPIAMLVEIGVDRYAAPWLAPKLYKWACD